MTYKKLTKKIPLPGELVWIETDRDVIVMEEGNTDSYVVFPRKNLEYLRQKR